MIILKQRLIYVLTAVLVFLVQQSFAQSDYPHWWGNKLGMDEIVLPGYTEVDVDKDKIVLGQGREYIWNKSILPVKIRSKNSTIVSDNFLELKINGKAVNLGASAFNLVYSSKHHAIVESFTKTDVDLTIRCLTRIEYDGLATVEIELSPKDAPVIIDSLTYRASVVANDWTEVQGFTLETIHKRQKQTILNLDYEGSLLSVIGIADGEKSFWWFVDEAGNWVSDLEKATKISRDSNYIKISQRIVDRKMPIVKPIKFNFNMMVTPVRDNVANIRQNRFARRITQEEARHQGINFWWINAFAHQNYPYLAISDELQHKLPREDLKNAGSAAKSKQAIKKAADVGIDLIPYFSAHMLNRFDPAYLMFRGRWKVMPERKWTKITYDAPFVLRRDDSYLTHNAEGYTDYLIFRFSELVDEIGIEGIYFDQGGVVGSINSLNSSSRKDSTENSHVVTDIIALRNFHKRLATLFYLKGKKGLIFSHNSNTAVIPAYSFITGTVQGEEYIHWLKNFNYLQSVGVDEVRTRLAGNAYGLSSIWLEIIYASENRLDNSKRPYPMTKEDWIESSYYKTAYLNFIPLALMHDIPTWSLAPAKLKNEILKYIDWVDPANSIFVGYWNFPKGEFEDNVYHSYYVSSDNQKIMLIIANMGLSIRRINFGSYANLLLREHRQLCDVWGAKDIYKAGVKENYLYPGSFFLVKMECGNDEI